MENLALTPCVSILLAHWSQVHDPEWYDPRGLALIAVMNEKSTKDCTLVSAWTYYMPVSFNKITHWIT